MKGVTLSMYEEEEYMYDDDRRRHHTLGSHLAMAFFKFIGVIFALPAMLIGAIHFWVLFGFGRLRWHLVTLITIIELLIILPIAKAYNPLSHIVSSVSFDTGIEWAPLIISYLVICLILGVIGGYTLISVKVMQFNNNPSILFMDGWMYRFSYRTTPWELINRRMLKSSIKSGKVYGPKYAPLGVREERPRIQVEEIDDTRSSLEVNKADIVSRSYNSAMKHTIVTGETGSGKTVTMLSLMYNDILNGYPLCVVDFKKSPDVLYFLSKWAKDYGREFYYFSGGDDEIENDYYGMKATYDPFDSGEQSSRTDVIMSLRKWDQASDVYRGRTEALLTALFFALLNVDKEDAPSIPWDEGGLNQIIAALDLSNMYNLILALDKKNARTPLSNTDLKRLNELKGLYMTLREKTPDARDLKAQLDGIKLICNKLIMSSYGNWLTKNDNSPHINLLEMGMDDDGPIILFGLSQMEEEEFAKSMGAIIMSDLKRSAHMKNEMHNKNPFGVYVDEFQTVDPRDATDLLEKSRSAGMFITLASQSLEKIAEAADTNGEATLKSVLDTCGNYLFHAGAQEDSAERMAKILGQTRHVTRRVSTESDSRLMNKRFFNQRRGRTSKEVNTDWIIAPSQFQNLSAPVAENGFKAEAYFISSFEDNKDSRTKMGGQRVQMIAQREITEGVPREFEEFIEELAIYKKNKYSKSSKEIPFYDEIKPPEGDGYENILPTLEKNIPTEEVIDDWEIEEIEETSTIINDNSEVKSKQPSTQSENNKPSIDDLESFMNNNQSNKSQPKALPEKEKKLTTWEKRQLEAKEKQSITTTKNKESKIEAKDNGFKLPDL